MTARYTAEQLYALASVLPDHPSPEILQALAVVGAIAGHGDIMHGMAERLGIEESHDPLLTACRIAAYHG